MCLEMYSSDSYVLENTAQYNSKLTHDHEEAFEYAYRKSSELHRNKKLLPQVASTQCG